MYQRALAVALLTLAASSSNAALLGRAPITPGGTDYQAYYDTVLNITWLADANLAATNTFGVSGVCTEPIPMACPQPAGAMDWYTAQNWIAAMNATDYLGVGNWRLPTADRNGDGIVRPCQNAPLSYCLDNEMEYMRWRNGISTATPAPFTNIADYVGFGYYWSGTEYATDPSRAWILNFGVYLQSPIEKTSANYVWAVSPGDLLPQSALVPIPAAVWLFGGAVAVLGLLKRRAG